MDNREIVEKSIKSETVELYMTIGILFVVVIVIVVDYYKTRKLDFLAVIAIVLFITCGVQYKNVKNLKIELQTITE